MAIYSIDTCVLPPFGTDVELSVSVAVCAPLINEWIEKFENGLVIDGTEAFQYKMIEQIGKVGLGKDEWHPVWHVIVHPDNREGGVLVSVDVHDLLRQLFHNGWNWTRVDACAAEIPDGPEGDRWVSKYTKVIQQSNGLLPKPLPRDQLKIATARGSHTTSSVHVLDASIPCKGIHPELCSEDGKISKSKILEKQPSLRQPIDKGIKYFVIKKQLVDACPKLMAMLARTGNVVHTTYRATTALQNCIRLHEVLTRDPNDTDDDVIKKASIGLALEFK